jgi:hypothetical protein
MRQSSEIPINESSRLRVGKEVAAALGVDPSDQPIEFACFFRHPGELICTSMANKLDQQHAMDGIFGQILAPEEQDEPVRIQALPPPELLVLPDRVHTFPAQWNKEKNQLHLKVGVDVLSRLSYQSNGKSVVRLLVRSRFLILMSDAHYQAAVAQVIPMRT